jgi:acetyl-CoA carboxylase biotin carboxylase subunit
MFDKVLIANRGEIALRIHRACREMGIATVAVHSTADADAMHVRLADEASASARPRPARATSTFPRSSRPAKSPAPMRSIRATAFCRRTPASPRRSRRTASTFIGPTAEHIRMMGDKIVAKQTAKELGLPLVPGSRRRPVPVEEAMRAGRQDRLSGAHQGRRRRRRARHEGRPNAEASCGSLLAPRAEAKAAFGNDAVYLEKYLARPRHIEIQVSATARQRGIHLGERDCSLQRRHQKVLEEAPRPRSMPSSATGSARWRADADAQDQATAAPARSSSCTRTASSTSSR